jgi:HMG (high mobility group) box
MKDGDSKMPSGGQRSLSREMDLTMCAHSRPRVPMADLAPTPTSFTKLCRSAFILFARNARLKVEQDNPGASHGEVGQILGALFRNLSAKERKFWDEAAAADRRQKLDGMSSSRERFLSNRLKKLSLKSQSQNRENAVVLARQSPRCENCHDAAYSS